MNAYEYTVLPILNQRERNPPTKVCQLSIYVYNDLLNHYTQISKSWLELVLWDILYTAATCADTTYSLHLDTLFDFTDTMATMVYIHLYFDDTGVDYIQNANMLRLLQRYNELT